MNIFFCLYLVVSANSCDKLSGDMKGRYYDIIVDTVYVIMEDHFWWIVIASGVS